MTVREWVWMRHPALPDSPPIRIARSAVPFHGATGWEQTDPPAPKTPPKQQEQGKQQATAKPTATSTTPRRQGKKGEGQ